MSQNNILDNTVEKLLFCWDLYNDTDKFFLFNPLSETYYFAMHTTEDSEECQNAPYAFYPMEFFLDEEKDYAVYFKNYCTVENGIIQYKNFELPEISEKKKQSVFCKNSLLTQIHTKQNNDDYADWESFFNLIQSKIASKEVEKVVASRKLSFQYDKNICTTSVLHNLLKENPETFIFAYQKNGETFLGASPELLVEKKINQFLSYALAGTISKNEKNSTSQGKKLLQDKKNSDEHNIVVKRIVKNMQDLAQAGEEKNNKNQVEISKTDLLELKNLFHLKTEISIYDDKHSLLSYVKRLHPTPAMGGEPKERALCIILENEKHNRGMYASPFGIIHKNGDGIFIVAIRSGLISKNVLHAYAGCGIIAQSECKKEYDEISNKLRTITESIA